MRKIILLIASVFISLSASAGHVAGGDISYEYIGDSTGIPFHYCVTAVIYRDNSGIDLGPYMTIDISSSCYSRMSITANQETDNANGPDGSYLIPYLNDCIDSSSVSAEKYLKYIYKQCVILPGPCADWKFSVTPPCCKSGGIQNLSDLGDSYYEVSLNNLGDENNTVEEGKIGRSLILCADKEVTIKPFGDDPDGDSLFIRFAPILSGPDPSDTIPFAPGYSVEYPIFTKKEIYFDQKSQTVRFTPSQAEVVQLKFEALEYRFDSAAFGYYIVGTRITEVSVIVLDICNSNVMNWRLNDFETGDMPKVDCFDQWISLKSPQKFNPETLIPTDFRVFSSDGTPYPVIETQTDTTEDFQATEARLKLVEELTENDTLTIYSKTGNDGNSVINSCGYELMGDSIQLILSNCSVSLLENESPDISLYPNPVNDRLYIRDERYLLQGDVKTKILSQTGRLIRESAPERKPDMFIPTDGLSPGLYFIRIEDQNGSGYFKRFIKK